MRKKRKSPVAKSLAKNSKAAMLSAIEIHNKPTFSYRYEVVVLLVLNAWELLLKGYIYKYHKKVKVYKKDGTTKPFLDCLAFVASQHGADFQVMKENLEKLYEYRNKVAHFYSEKLDIVIFALLKRNVELYQKFILKYFSMDLSSDSDLILLPIGFKKPYSPFDFLSNKTSIKESSAEVRNFLISIINSIKNLNTQGIEDSILSDFKVSLINEKRIKNADIIAGINNKIDTGIDITVLNPKQAVRLTEDPSAHKVILTRDKNIASGTFLHEELSNELFHEINNVVDANTLLADGRQEFLLGEPVYYRIYSERNHLSYEVKNIDLLARAGISFYAPHLFFLANLPAKSFAKIIYDFAELEKYLQMNAIIRIAVLLGPTVCRWLFKKLHSNWGTHPQPPNYYWNLQKFMDHDWKRDSRLVAHKKTISAILTLPDDSTQYSIDMLIKDQVLTSNLLSKVCIAVFDGNKEQKNNSRLLDTLTYGKEIEKKSSSIGSELLKIDSK